MRRIGRDCIEKRIKAVTSGEEVPNDILTQILQSSVGVKSVDMETLVDDFITFFVAGQETAAYTLSFAIILIHQHPEVLDHLLSEVEGVLGDRKEVTGDDLDKMKYTEQVIQEVLRLYPLALPSLSKDSPKGGIVMSGYHIPEGTVIERSMMGASTFASSGAVTITTTMPMAAGTTPQGQGEQGGGFGGRE
eukprot:Em0012g985a